MSFLRKKEKYMRTLFLFRSKKKQHLLFLCCNKRKSFSYCLLRFVANSSKCYL